MKRILVSAVLCFATASALADPVYESFSYDSGSGLPGQIGPNGLTWTAAGPSGPNVAVQSGSLSVPGLAPSIGNKIGLQGTTGPSARLPIGTTTSTGAVYFSFALQVPSLAGLSSTGGYFAALNDAVGTTSTLPTSAVTRVLIRLVTGGSGYNLGLDKGSGSPTNYVWDPRTFFAGATVFILGSYTFNAGTQDVAQLWLSPSSSTFGQPAPPTTVLSAAAGPNLAQVASFIFFQCAGGVQPDLAYVDELRIGTNWASVTPGQAPAVALFPKTQTDECRGCASFTPSVIGTPPISYQWYKNQQLIPGANGSFYTTPPLTLSDSGSTYTVVLTNAFGSATSDVASVTVLDTRPPRFITSPSDLTVTAPDLGGATVSYPNPTASDSCDSNPSVSSVPPSGMLFRIGSTLVNCEAADSSGNRTSRTFQVTVFPPRTLISTNQCPSYPPVEMITLEQWHAYYANGIIVSNVTVTVPASGLVMPAPGTSLTNVFASQAELWMSTNGGTKLQQVLAGANVTVVVTNKGPAGPVRFYDTEMLQLDLSGGSLPPMVEFRVSPTKASIGKTLIEAVPDGITISSFFDVFTEVSTDAGTNWSSSTSGPMTLVLLLAQCPGLGIALVTTGPTPAVRLTWPADGARCALQSASSLAPPIPWSPVTRPVIVEPSGYRSVTITNLGAVQFFRLCGECR